MPTVNTGPGARHTMSREFAITLVPAVIMLGFAVFGVMHISS